MFLSSHTDPDIVERTEKLTSYGYIVKDSGDTVLLASIKMAFRLFEAKARLLKSEQSYRSMFEANPHPMWVYDLDTLRFLAVNNAAITHYGYSASEFLDMTIRDIRPGKDVDRLMRNVATVDSGIDLAGVWRHLKKSGDLISVEIISHAIDWKGTAAEVVLAHDVSAAIKKEYRN